MFCLHQTEVFRSWTGKGRSLELLKPRTSTNSALLCAFNSQKIKAHARNQCCVPYRSILCKCIYKWYWYLIIASADSLSNSSTQNAKRLLLAQLGKLLWHETCRPNLLILSPTTVILLFPGHAADAEEAAQGHCMVFWLHCRLCSNLNKSCNRSHHLYKMKPFTSHPSHPRKKNVTQFELCVGFVSCSSGSHLYTSLSFIQPRLMSTCQGQASLSPWEDDTLKCEAPPSSNAWPCFSPKLSSWHTHLGRQCKREKGIKHVFQKEKMTTSPLF